MIIVLVGLGLRLSVWKPIVGGCLLEIRV
jgi:hypothetical protein